jgi:hypothetical protein
MRGFISGCLVVLLPLSGCDSNPNPGGPSALISPSAAPRPPIAFPSNGFQQKSLQEVRREMLEKKAKEEVAKAPATEPSGDSAPGLAKPEESKPAAPKDASPVPSTPPKPAAPPSTPPNDAASKTTPPKH